MAAATLSLQQAQQYTRDWGDTRRTPFGLPIPRLALPVTIFGSATGLVYGTQALLLTFQTRANWFFVAVGIVLGFQGGGNAPGPGDVLYTVDIDAPLVNPAGTGYIEKDYGAVPFPIGNLTFGLPWPVEWKHNNGETLRVKGTPIANMGIGAGNFLTAALVGWEWPAEGWEE
jgi:hypothetical protein